MVWQNLVGCRWVPLCSTGAAAGCPTPTTPTTPQDQSEFSAIFFTKVREKKQILWSE